MSIAQFMGTLKSKGALMIFDRYANLKYKYGSRNFWCHGYFVDTVSKNAKMIEGVQTKPARRRFGKRSGHTQVHRPVYG